MKTDVNGCSTCPKGEERFEKFYSRILKRYLYQYDYRHPDGELFSCASKSLDECREKRDKWLRQKEESMKIQQPGE